MKSYEAHFEIAGPMAMFTRPDTGSAPVSYPVPTFSAAKGMFENVARFTSAYICPRKVEICCDIEFEKYTTNYGGPLRKSSQISEETPYQLPLTVLINVCYRIYGEVEEVGKSPNGNNHLHALQDIFNRRLTRGQFFSTPFLGLKEFVPDYFGTFREGTKVNESINMTIPSFLMTVFDKPINGEYKPVFKEVSIVNGVLNYAE